jgi:hypothetical protein
MEGIRFFISNSSLQLLTNALITFLEFYAISLGKTDWSASSFSFFTHGTNISSLTVNFEASNVNG